MFKTQKSLALENLARRHQVGVLRRTVANGRLCIGPAERALHRDTALESDNRPMDRALLVGAKRRASTHASTAPPHRQLVSSRWPPARPFDFGDPDVVAQAVRLWSRVAEHFAANARPDLFYELLNEPEQSSGATSAVPAAKWTDVAGQMIAAIRAADTSHTIIFGDVNWYGIDKLSARDPFPDDNVIYAFHIYEPYIFTHQGASWTSMSATHDIPYPYSPERWSEDYKDLGFSASLESWILDQVKSYYINGNRSALRNQIIEAKRWAVEHNVPVICNEFGAYDTSSRLEDRVRYYTDIVSIFTELAIPWQHWFMVMAKDGTVIPEYRQAFGLGS